LESTPTLRCEALVDARLTDRFNVLRTTLTGRNQWRARGFTILLVVEGACDIATAHAKMSLKQFDRVVIPHGLDALEINGKERSVLLECLPPTTEGL
jgi:mannose-6-phosphate isomerase class I